MRTLFEFLNEYINEWKEDLGSQVVIIMGTPGCGKTYWMQHTGNKFFKTQGLKLNPKELDVDHTLKFFQIIDFPNFCHRLINYHSTTIFNKETGNSVHNKDAAWKTFIKNELNRYTELNKQNGGLDTNIPKLDLIDWDFVSPWLTRYFNAQDNQKDKVFHEFERAMYNEYFNKVFASDFSVRDEAKLEYNKELQNKLNSGSDVFIAISGAKFKHIKEISTICQQNGITCRIVYLNGSIEKAIGQDAKRDRSGGKDFVIEYAKNIEKVWNKLIDPSAEEYYKNNGIYNIYEFIDSAADDVESYPVWKLKQIYK